MLARARTVLNAVPVLALLGALLPAAPRAAGPLPMPAGGGASSLIDVDALPEAPAVRDAWREVIALEPYAGAWSHEWPHPVPRAEVATRIGDALGALRRAAAGGASSELLLAVGIAARYAHNLDVAGAPEAGLAALDEAAGRPGADPRADWFAGTNLCQMARPERGVPRLEAAEAGARRLPRAADYWGEAFFCYAMANLPARATRAARELDKLRALPPGLQPLADHARALLRDPDPAAELSPREAWTLEPDGERAIITSGPCGFSLAVERGDRWQMTPVRGACATLGELGPFPGKTGPVTPMATVLARRAKGDETLEAFAATITRALPDGGTAVDGLPCPAARCLAREVSVPASYAPEGGGRVVVVFFERAEPELRGLGVERIRPMPHEGPSDAPRVYRPQPRLVRFAGRMFYFALLDTARSVEGEARAEYLRLLRGLTVE
jgi:hypothetical protein